MPIKRGLAAFLAFSLVTGSLPSRCFASSFKSRPAAAQNPAIPVLPMALPQAQLELPFPLIDGRTQNQSGVSIEQSALAQNQALFQRQPPATTSRSAAVAASRSIQARRKTTAAARRILSLVFGARRGDTEFAEPESVIAAGARIHKDSAALSVAAPPPAPVQRRLPLPDLSAREQAGEHRLSRAPFRPQGSPQISALKKALALSAAFIAIELAGGFLTGSVALKADATHLSVDWLINAAALAAIWIEKSPATLLQAFRRWKAESIVGLVSSAAILITAGHVGIEAVHRLSAPVEIPGLATALLALAGLASNVVSCALLYRYREDSVGVKAVFLHAFVDALGSLGIIVSGLLIFAFGWWWSEPVISLLIAALILHSGWDLLKRSWKARKG